MKVRPASHGVGDLVKGGTGTEDLRVVEEGADLLALTLAWASPGSF